MEFSEILSVVVAGMSGTKPKLRTQVVDQIVQCYSHLSPHPQLQENYTGVSSRVHCKIWPLSFQFV